MEDKTHTHTPPPEPQPRQSIFVAAAAPATDLVFRDPRIGAPVHGIGSALTVECLELWSMRLHILFVTLHA